MRRTTRTTLSRDSLRCFLVLVCLTLVSGCVAFLPYPKITHHFDNFVVMETPTRDYGVGKRGMVRVSLEFYRHYKDEFDLVVLVLRSETGFFPDHWGTGVQGRMAVVRNALQGTGTSRLNFGHAFGSDEKLKGVVQLASNFQILDGALLHEFMHLWYFNLEIFPTSVFGHWGFSSVGGRLGGFQRDELNSLGDGKYSAGYFQPQDGRMALPYGDLEMYLAGWIPANEVPDIWVAEDGEWLKKDLTEEELADCEIKEGPLAGTYKLDCTTELDADGNKIFTASKTSTRSMEQIIEKIGPRVPSVEDSQKEFRIAFILVTHGSEPVTEKDLKLTESFIERFTAKTPLENPFKVRLDDSSRVTVTFNNPWGKKGKPLNFWEATRGMATVEAGDLQSYRR